MYRPRILIADDDPAIIRFVRANLKAEDYQTFSAMDGVEALQVIEKELPDLVILDIMMPRMNGVEVCRQIREWSKVPIIMLSARGDENDKVTCLELGADDYLTKPFGIRELMARIKVALRHSDAAEYNPDRPTLVCGEIEIDFTKRRVMVAGRDADLTATEYRMLCYLAENTGRVLTHEQILHHIWGEEYSGETHMLQVYISRVRKKIGDNTRDRRYVLTRPGIGYMMREPE